MWLAQVENFICVPPRSEKQPDLDEPIFGPVVIDDDDDEVAIPQQEAPKDVTTHQDQEEVPKDVTMPQDQEEVPKDVTMPQDQEEVPTAAPMLKPGSAIQAALNRQTTIELEVTCQ